MADTAEVEVDAQRYTVEQYREQLRLYAVAAARLWPDRDIQPRLLFTACGSLVAAG